VEAYWEDELEQAGRPEHDEIDQARDLLGEEGVAGSINNSTFARLSLMRGMEGLLVDLLDQPDRMHALMELASRYRERELRSFLESGADIYVYDICWATGAGMSPAMFREWVWPDLVKMCGLARGTPGKYFGIYTLGRIGCILDMLVDAGPSFIASFEQNEGDLTLAEAKKRVGDRVCLIGNFDPLILQEGSLDDARREAKRCLAEGMEGGGYVLGTGDEVPPTARLDNLKAMVEMADEHGRY
jgi:uroporphyrinogen decarboxylase